MEIGFQTGKKPAMLETIFQSKCLVMNDYQVSYCLQYIFRSILILGLITFLCYLISRFYRSIKLKSEGFMTQNKVILQPKSLMSALVLPGEFI